MAIENRAVSRDTDLSSMFGIVTLGSIEAEINLARQRKVAEMSSIREIPLWDPRSEDPNRKPPAGIHRVR